MPLPATPKEIAIAFADEVNREFQELTPEAKYMVAHRVQYLIESRDALAEKESTRRLKLLTAENKAMRERLIELEEVRVDENGVARWTSGEEDVSYPHPRLKAAVE